MYIVLTPVKPPYKSHKLMGSLWAHTGAIGCIVLSWLYCIGNVLCYLHLLCCTIASQSESTTEANIERMGPHAVMGTVKTVAGATESPDT